MTDSQLMKETRKALGLTQSEMAERIGYASKYAVSKVERGERNVSGPTRKLLLQLSSQTES